MNRGSDMELSAENQALLVSALEEERLEGVRALGGYGIERHLQTLLNCFGDSSWRVRKQACELFLGWPKAPQFLGDIVALLHAHDNAGLRNAAVEVLTRMGGQSVSCLLKEIQCSDADVRKFVLDILGDIGDESALGAMVGALGDQDQNVRNAAAENLGKLRAAPAIPALLASMATANLWFRFTILAAIAQIGAPVAASELLPYKEDPLLRKAVFDCLGKIGDSEVISILCDGLHDRMSNVRAAAALALQRIGRKHPALVGEALQHCQLGAPAEVLVELLQTSDPQVRLAAVQLLRWLADPEVAPHLLSLLDDEAMRQPAAEALIALGPPAARVLLPRWAEASSRERTYLAYLSGQIRLPEAAELLAEALDCPDSDLRMVAAQGLGLIGSGTLLPRLLSALRDPVAEVREQVVNAMIDIGRQYPAEAISALTPLLQSEAMELRLCAVRILGRLDGPAVLASLQLALKDEAAKVRSAAVQALSSGSLGCDLSAMRLAMTDEDPEVRRLAVGALGSAPVEEGVGLLSLALQDDDLWVRAMVVRTLGQFGPPAVQLVEMALADPVGLVAIAALETLADISFEQSYPKIVQALQHPDQEVVVAALQLLANGERRDWLPESAHRLLNHPHWEVRSGFVRLLAELEGPSAREHLESRFLVEGEDLVREQILQVLSDLSGEG